MDIHQGIESTLHHAQIPAQARRQGGAGVRPERCRISARTASELNQVWTNLIDNAMDAMGRERRAAHPYGA